MGSTLRRLLFGAAAIMLAALPALAGTILGKTGRTCYAPTFNSGGIKSDIQVYGDWIETIDRVTASSGLSVTIADKQNGAQHQDEPFKGRGMVTLKVITNNASAGQKTITLNGGIFGSASFNVTVVPRPEVTGVDVPVQADPFQEVTVTLQGSGLQEARDPASGSIITNDELTPFVTVGGNASITGVRVLSTSNTSLQARIFFSALIQDATVELRFHSTSVCTPLGADPNPFKTRVRVKSTNVKNFVKSVTFPNGSTFDVNSVATIHVNLLFPAPGGLTATTSSGLLQAGVGARIQRPQIPASLRDALAANATLRNANSTIFFQLIPRDAFEAVQGGTPLNASGLTQVSAQAGDDIIPLTFKVKNCLGGQPGTVNSVKIQIWMHNTNRTLPPEFVEKQFGVRCIP